MSVPAKACNNNNAKSYPRATCLITFVALLGVGSGAFVWALGSQEQRLTTMETAMLAVRESIAQGQEDRRHINNTLTRIETKLDSLLKSGASARRDEGG